MRYDRCVFALGLAWLAACGSSHEEAAPSQEALPRPETPGPREDVTTEASPFGEWMDHETWTRLSAVEARERARIENACPPASAAEVEARDRILAESAACATACERTDGLNTDARSLVFLGRGDDTSPRPLPSELAPYELERIAQVRAACAPLVQSVAEASLVGASCFASSTLEMSPAMPERARARLVLLRASHGVDVEAWMRAREGDVDGAARLLVQGLVTFAALSRIDTIVESAVAMSAIEPWTALLEAWRDALDPTVRSDLAAPLARAAAMPRIARDTIAHQLVTDAARVRAASEPEWARSTTWEATLVTLDALDDTPDAGLSARRAQLDQRTRAQWDAILELDRRTEPPLLEHRALVVLHHESTIVRGMRSVVAQHTDARDRLRALSASWTTR